MWVVCSASQLGNTPLHTAVSAGHLETAEVLVTCEAALEAVNHRGVTPLYIAVEAGDAAMTRMLLTYGADFTFARPHVRSQLVTFSRSPSATHLRLCLFETSWFARKAQDGQSILHVAIKHSVLLEWLLMNSEADLMATNKVRE